MLGRIVVSTALLSSAACASFAAPPIPRGASAPRNLRCEYLTDPMGLDERAPRLSWELVDMRRGVIQHAYHVIAADSPDALGRDDGNLWDTGHVVSDQSIQVVYTGKPLGARQRVWWKVRVWVEACGPDGSRRADDQPSPWSEPAHWSMGLLDPADWGAKWIGDGAPPASAPTEPLPPPMLRTSFAVPDAGVGIKQATVYVTARGLYELHINGQRVGNHVLAPEWTDYRRRIQYQTYDVTDLLRAGQNAVGAMLGDGWYAGRIGLTGIVPGGPSRGIYGPRPQLLLRLDVELADGRTQTVVSDESWRVTLDGPIRAADLLDGEVYDVRRELPGWDRPGFDGSRWQHAGVYGAVDAAYSGPALCAQPNEPIRITQQRTAVAVSQPAPGVYVFDLGQNFAGWVWLRVRGPAGRVITLRHAEVLNPDGTLYTANLRGARQTDQYTLEGCGEENLEPHFTYHGFRYVEVTGPPIPPAPGTLIGCVFHSAASQAGRFECSSSLLNKLAENIAWTQRANMMSVPTDCPQRDERLGWTGDILAFAQTACFDRDMAAFFTKWIPDVRDAQTEDGRYPDFAPHPYDPAVRFSSAPAWGDAGVFVPWCAYVNYGDRRLLERHFESAKRWIDYVHAKNPELLWKESRGNDYGDWLNADTLKLADWPMKGAEVPKEVFATMFFARAAELVGRMATVLGHSDDAACYHALAGRIRDAFNAAYVDADGRIEGNTQAGYALALSFGLLPEARRTTAAHYMLAAFDTYAGHISTGFHSTICLMHELTRYGYVEEAYRLINNRTMPSWGYAIDHGATTIWERWDGFVEGRGFQDPGMNSFSHYALGSVGEWMYRTILGISPDEAHPGYKHFVIRPQPGGGLTWAKGEYRSIHGTIACAWKIDGGYIDVTVTVPPNTSATVYVPTDDPAAITESGKPITQAPGVAAEETEGDGPAYRIGSGTYVFRVPFSRSSR